MDLTDVLKQHQQVIEQAKKAMIAKEVSAKDLEMPLDMKKQRIEAVTARIDGLSAQKEDAIKRYDAAIAQHKDELARLKGDIDKDEAVVKALMTPREDMIEQLKKAAKQVDEEGRQKGGRRRPPKKRAN